MMNRWQKNYAEAKVVAEATARAFRENEAEYIRQIGYRNADGTVPEAIYMVDNDDDFDRLSTGFELSPLNISVEVQRTQQYLTDAENALIDFALTLVPQPQRDTLDRNRNIVRIRKKLLDCAFRLDVSTLKGGAV